MEKFKLIKSDGDLVTTVNADYYEVGVSCATYDFYISALKAVKVASCPLSFIIIKE